LTGRVHIRDCSGVTLLVEEDAPGSQLFDIRITPSGWNEDKTIGDIDGIWVYDIFLNSDQKFQPSRSRFQGFSAENTVRNVRLENICMQGRYAATRKTVWWMSRILQKM